ncbi:beta-propeller fold lactonase family protein [Nitratireductor sp. XY-223]|uniref:YncE family protein n=1 Tax=Nitratireductor sp. XY-223 TaxID=2561926 RepID=UPI00145A81EF|nr:beta-propeller fold lactonase family protein [Nitratireductor sp. XY-223]
MRTILLTACSLAALSVPVVANTLVVGNKFDGTVSFIDLDSGKEITRSPAGGSPHEVAISPDGKTAVVVSYKEEGYVGEELNLFDVATGNLQKTISIAPHRAPHGIGWIGNTNSVIATTEETRDVIRVDLGEGRVSASATTDQIGSHLLALSPDFSTSYVTSRGSDTVSVIDVDLMELLETVAAGQGPEAVDVSPDGRHLWVGNNLSRDIIVFDTGSMEQVARIDAGFLPIRVRFHPDGGSVAVADLKGDRVVVYDAASREMVSEIDLAAGGLKTPASLLFAPDGSALFVGAQSTGNVAEIDVGTWSLKRVLDAGDGADGLGYSDIEIAVS